MSEEPQTIGIPEETERFAPRAKRMRFFAGTILIAASFLVYAAYPLLAFLPLSAQIKVLTVVAASLLSWGIFGAGVLLTGREGYDWLKGRWRRSGHR